MQNLNPKLFDADVEQLPIRKGFGDGLLEAGKNDPTVVALCADLTESTMMHLFREAFPKRFVEIGVAEQNLVTVASGLAATGKMPFVSSYAMFSPGRNWEQIRTTICYNDRGVVVVGSHAGISVGPDGGTHQAVEDIALMRVIPNMIVICPCDAIEARKATLALSKLRRPAYLRLARDKTPIVTTDDTPFEIGRGQVLFDGANGGKNILGIIATGSLVYNAIMAARQLTDAGIPTKVLHLATIKPMDESAVLSLAQEVEGVVTAEEHQIAGGLGGAVSEFLSENNPIRMSRVGVRNQFGQSGTPAELIEHYGMGISHIVAAGKMVIDK